jgi:hypothetical protein
MLKIIEIGINNDYINVVKVILTDAKDLANNKKTIKQINATYVDLVTSLVHINSDFFKNIQTTMIDKDTITSIIKIISPNNNIGVYNDYNDINYKISNSNLFNTNTGKDCGCNK